MAAAPRICFLRCDWPSGLPNMRGGIADMARNTVLVLFLDLYTGATATRPEIARAEAGARALLSFQHVSNQDQYIHDFLYPKDTTATRVVIRLDSEHPTQADAMGSSQGGSIYHSIGSAGSSPIVDAIAAPRKKLDFANGSTALSEEALLVVREIANYSRASNVTVRIQVTAGGDSVIQTESEHLRHGRENAIATELLRDGIDAAKITIPPSPQPSQTGEAVISILRRIGSGDEREAYQYARGRIEIQPMLKDAAASIAMAMGCDPQAVIIDGYSVSLRQACKDTDWTSQLPTLGGSVAEIAGETVPALFLGWDTGSTTTQQEMARAAAGARALLSFQHVRNQGSYIHDFLFPKSTSLAPWNPMRLDIEHPTQADAYIVNQGVVHRLIGSIKIPN